ncbi:lipopolysaccharide biosynthesis protein [Niabella sp.]|uniref:lipopolysaccharide biosynthesis protein n=1 Tax=Niabella sp. TaxID=1962976 RepID=UPI00262B553A|nr:lipopolysaccharide biosynthesis protein [Niabella sp.]
MNVRKNKLLSNLLVTGIGRFGGMLIQLVTTFVLSRFLSAEDFGIVAMCSIFLSISEMLVDSGMGGSIIFYKDVRAVELHTLFWTNLVVSLAIYFLLFLGAGWIAALYKVPLLEIIIKVIGVSVVVNSLCIIQSAVLSKNLQFKIQSKIMFWSTVCASVVVLLMGYYGAGIWALVAQPVLQRFFTVIFYMIYGSYRPAFQYSLVALKRHWGFGSKLLGTSFIKTVYDNLYVQIVGKVTGLQEAGFYAQAKRFNDVPVNLLTFSLDKVVFPSLAGSRHQLDKMERITRLFALCIFPFLFLAALVSKELVVLLLGVKWISSGWMLSFLMIGTVGASMEVLTRSFLKATGKTGVLLKFDIVKRTISILILIVAMYWSVKGLLVAFILNGFIGWFFNCVALNKAVGYTVAGQLRTAMSVCVMAAFAYVLMSLTTAYFHDHYAAALVSKATGYSILYVFFAFLFMKEDMLRLFKASFSKKIVQV